MSYGVKIFAGRASKVLADQIATKFGATLGDVKVTEFSDGEFQPSFEETVRGQDVFIVQSTMPPTENIFELLLMVDAAKRANAYAKKLDTGLAICHKHRKKANEVAEMTVIGDVAGKDVILIDDMCDTAGTLTKAAELFIEKGAKSVRAFCTHAVLSGPALERINNSKLTELIVTDTIPLKEKSDKIRVITVADLFADVIDRLVKNESISTHFIIS